MRPGRRQAVRGRRDHDRGRPPARDKGAGHRHTASVSPDPKNPGSQLRLLAEQLVQGIAHRGGSIVRVGGGTSRPSGPPGAESKIDGEWQTSAGGPARFHACRASLPGQPRHCCIEPEGADEARRGGGSQARMGVVRVPCAAEGSRTFALESRASVPYLDQGGPGNPVGQYPEGGGASPVPSSAAVPDEASQSCESRARREVEWVSVRDSTTTPIVGVSPAAPTPLPASLPYALPSRPGDEPHGARVHPRSVGPSPWQLHPIA
jgi:hypothetical protein